MSNEEDRPLRDRFRGLKLWRDRSRDTRSASPTTRVSSVSHPRGRDDGRPVSQQREIKCPDNGSASIDQDDKTPSQPKSFWDRAVEELAQDEDKRSLLSDYQDVLMETLNRQNQVQNIPGQQRNSTGLATQPVGDLEMIKNRERMKELATDKLNEMVQKQWIIRWRGKRVFEVRKVVARIVSTIEQFSGLIGQAVSCAPSPATPAWAGVCVLISLVTADTEERSKAIDGLDQVSFAIARAVVVEKGYSKSYGSDDMFEKAMINLYSALIVFYAKATCYFSRHEFTRFARNTFRYDDWSSVLSEITRKDNEVNTFAIQLSLLVLTENMRDLKEAVSREQTRSHVKELLSWTCPKEVNAGDQHSDAKRKLGDRYMSSGQWLLEHDIFRFWEQTSGCHLWLRGAVGTGKTSLITVTVEKILPKYPSVAYFYCLPNLGISDASIDMTKRSHELILRSLIAQLALSPDGKTVAEELELAYDASSRKGTQGTSLSQEESFELLVEIVESRDNAIIIIDALDECPRYSELTYILGELARRSQRLKLLLSSQPHVDVNAHIPSTARITIESELNCADMTAYIEEELDLFMRVQSTVLEEALRREIAESLTKNSNGMFKWTQLSLQLLLDFYSEDDVSQIKITWEEMKRRPNEGILRELINMYERLWNRDLPSPDLPSAGKKRKQAHDMALLIFKWAFREANLLDCIIGDKVGLSKIPKLCRAALVESEPGNVQISHSSANEYLALKIADLVGAYVLAEDSERQRILSEAHDIAGRLADIEICASCLSCLLADDTTQLSLLPHASDTLIGHYGVLKDRERLPEDVQKMVFSLFSPEYYAVFKDSFVQYGSTALANEMLRFLFDEEFKGTQLYYATSLGLHWVVRDLIKAGADVNAKGGSCSSSLQCACARGDHDMALILLQNNADVNGEGGVYSTALQAATAGGYESLVRMMIVDYSANVDIRGGLFGSALQAALSRSDDRLVGLLTDNGARYDPAGGRVWLGAFKALDKDLLNYFTRSPAFPLKLDVPYDYQLPHPRRLWQAAADLSEDVPSARCPGRFVSQLKKRMEIDDWHWAGFMAARLPWVMLKILFERYDLFRNRKGFRQARDAVLNVEKHSYLTQCLCQYSEKINSLTAAECNFQADLMAIMEAAKLLRFIFNWWVIVDCNERSQRRPTVLEDKVLVDTEFWQEMEMAKKHASLSSDKTRKSEWDWR